MSMISNVRKRARKHGAQTRAALRDVWIDDAGPRLLMLFTCISAYSTECVGVIGSGTTAFHRIRLTKIGRQQADDKLVRGETEITTTAGAKFPLEARSKQRASF